MKKIEAIIRPEKLTDVLAALGEGYSGIMITEIQGHGKQKGITQMWRGQKYRVEFMPKVKLEVVVKDADLARISEAIIKSARTGEIGDGKIFVYNVEGVQRIRTGETGEIAV